MDHGNGNPEQLNGANGGVQTITIRETPGTFHTRIEMDTKNLDCALRLLESAHREIEARFRFVRAQELLAEKVHNDNLKRIAEDVARGVSRRA